MFTIIVNNWESWVHTRRGGADLGEWALRSPALAGWDPGELQRPRASARTDAMQAALVALGQAGDSAAITTLLVQLRPGLGTVAAWLARVDNGSGSFEVATTEVISAFYEVVMGHDLTRRPTKIAANLVLDTRQKLWRAIGRSRPLDELTAETEAVQAMTAQPIDEALDERELTAAIARALAGLGGSADSRRLTAELAFRTWILGQPGTDAADELGLARNAARTRLCRLRQVVRTETGQPAAA